MLAGSLFVGVHMALTHGVTLGMVASYIPATSVPGIGRITGTCWSFTDFVFGAPPPVARSVFGAPLPCPSHPSVPGIGRITGTDFVVGAPAPIALGRAQAVQRPW